MTRGGASLIIWIKRVGPGIESRASSLPRPPGGATFQLKRRLWLVRQNPVVDEGALITVTKKPEPGESVPFDLGATIRDTFAIISSAVTIIVIAQQIIAK